MISAKLHVIGRIGRLIIELWVRMGEEPWIDLSESESVWKQVLFWFELTDP